MLTKKVRLFSWQIDSCKAIVSVILKVACKPQVKMLEMRHLRSERVSKESENGVKFAEQGCYFYICVG